MNNSNIIYWKVFLKALIWIVLKILNLFRIKKVRLENYKMNRGDISGFERGCNWNVNKELHFT